MIHPGEIDLRTRMADIGPDVFAQPEPRFTFELGHATDYARLLAGEDLSRATEEDLWTAATTSGRLLLLGDGGSGKTSLLGRLWQTAHDREAFAVWVDLRNASGVLAHEWNSINEDSWSAELLLQKLGVPRVGEQELELAAGHAPLLILIDGINEVTNPVAERLLQTADYLARSHPRLGVVVTDRLVRRESVSPRWKLMRVTAARDGETSHEPLLRNAFFLNLALSENLEGPTANGAVRAYLQEHAGLTPEELANASYAAAKAYENRESRVFEIEAFTRDAGYDVGEKLRVAGALTVHDNVASFEHQLIHDSLAAQWLAENPETWTARWLNAMTFQASSFDVLALALESLADEDLVDSFVRRVYDWNYYGAAYAMSRAQELGGANVSPTMRLALLAMLAERQWDPIVATVDRVQDGLRLIGDATAERMLSAVAFHDVKDLVAATAPSDQAFEAWRLLFLRESDNGDEELVERLREEDSLLGWTAANVLRRTSPSDTMIDRVVELAESDSSVVRWRSAHVLGAWPDVRSHLSLRSHLLDDSDQLVRYGAVRSLIDLAAIDPSLCDDIMPWLAERAWRLPEPSAQVLSELERALVRDPMPAGWIASVSDVVNELFAHSVDDRQRERWRRLAGQLRRHAEPVTGKS